MVTTYPEGMNGLVQSTIRLIVILNCPDRCCPQRHGSGSVIRHELGSCRPKLHQKEPPASLTLNEKSGSAERELVMINPKKHTRGLTMFHSKAMRQEVKAADLMCLILIQMGDTL